MGKLTLFDKIIACEKRGEDMPLKGHATVILTDVRDGTKKIIESDNMVTNATASLFSKSWSSLARFNALRPLKNLYGGVMCFQNPLTENANAFNPPSELVSPLVAHCGNLPNDTASTLRGSRVPADEEETETSVRYAFFWPATSGNGTISSVCLCPTTMGNMGLKPFDATFNPLSAFGNDAVTDNWWNSTISKQYPFNIDDDGQTSYSVWLDGTTFTEYVSRHDYFKFGIMRGTRDWQDVSNRSATVRSGDNRIVFDDADYYYIARATSATTLQVDKVNKSTFAVTQADCTFSGVTLYTGTINPNKNGNFRIYAFDGTYLYFPNGNGNQFVKLNLANNTDVTALDGEITIEKTNASAANYQFMTPLVINDGLILGGNYIINGNAAYPINHVKGIGGADTYLAGQHWLWLVKKGAAVYGNARQTYGTDSSQWSGQSCVFNQMMLTTINNIEPVVKSTSLTMEILYTLNEI